MKCETCKGSGDVYLNIAGDIHITKCATCDGWGTVEQIVKPKEPKNFGAVDIDSLLDES